MLDIENEDRLYKVLMKVDVNAQASLKNVFGSFGIADWAL